MKPPVRWEMGHVRALRLVILPQALYNALPKSGQSTGVDYQR